MDQIYLPKNRVGFSAGSYILVKPLENENIKNIEKVERLYFYKINKIEPIKIRIIDDIIKVVNKNLKDYGNLIIMGSFLEKGFNFNDIDILIISREKINDKLIREEIEKYIGVKTHIISLNSKELMKSLSTDPLYSSMLSQYVAKKRFIYRVNRKMNYKLLDLALLKSKLLIDNFDALNGNEKYYLVRNIISILLWIKNEKIDKELVDKETIHTFNIKNVSEIKLNILNKESFLKKYKSIYKEIFNKIMEGIKNDPK